MKTTLPAKFRDYLLSIANKCTNQEKVIAVKKLKKNFHTDRDKHQKVNKKKIKKSSKKVEAHLEFSKISTL